MEDKLNTIKEFAKTHKDTLKDYTLVVEYDLISEKRIVKKRIFWHDFHGLCTYRKGSSRSGYEFTLQSNITDLKLVKKSKKTEKEKWESSWLKVIQTLEKSGLWTELLQTYKIGFDIGYDKIKEASQITGNYRLADGYEENRKKQIELIRQIDSRLVSENGYNTDILWHMDRPAVVKKMYFGKFSNALQHIAEAVKNNEKYSTGRHYNGSYDASFEYNPEIKKAWYSEEYKDCGNGHYYLALSDTHAVYYEKD